MALLLAACAPAAHSHPQNAGGDLADPFVRSREAGTIQVVGVANERVALDHDLVSAHVGCEAATAESLRKECSARLVTLREVIDQSGLAPDDIVFNLGRKRSDFLRPVPDQAKGVPTAKAQPRAHILWEVQIHVRDRGKTVALVHALDSFGVESMSVCATLADESKTRDRLRALAVEDARAQAEQLARAVDAKIGRVRKLVAVDSAPDVRDCQRGPEAIEGSSIGSQMPTALLSSKVEVEFELL